MKSDNKTILVNNFLSIGAIQIANYVLPLISVPIIARIIGPEKYGVLSFASTFVAYFILIIGYGFDLTATRRISADPANKEVRNKVFTEVLSARILLFSVCVGIFFLLVVNVPQLEEEKTVNMFTFLICISALITPNWFFQAMQDLSKLALLTFLSNLLFTISIILIVRDQEDYIWQPLILSAVQILITTIALIWAIKKYDLKIVSISIRRCLGLLWEEKVVFFSLIVINLYTTTNTFILGIYQNEAQVGYYTSAQKLIFIAQAVLTLPLASAFFPFIGRAFGVDRADGITKVQKLIPFIVCFTGCASIVMFAIGPLLLTLLYGEEFAPATRAFQILAFIPFLVALNNMFGTQIMLNLKMDREFFGITFLGAVVSIVLNFLMIKKLGFIGTAINWISTEFLIALSMYICLRRQGVNPINLTYFKYATIVEYLQPLRSKFLR